ncbi:MAG: sensor histidine kinase [Anaerolineae bacterium]|nr:sensor histidine kinase [Anaerolineae bacterium]
MERLRRQLPSLSLLQRIVIANTVIIVIGAIGGTLLTAHLASRVGAVGLILAFAGAGILFSFAVNYALVSAALRPLYTLRDRASAIAAGAGAIQPVVAPDADRDVQELGQALATLVQQLESRNRELEALSQRILDTEEAECRRVARTLHDDTSQYLSMLIVQLERLEQRLPPEEEPVYSQIVRSREMAQQILQELRTLIHGLRPTLLDDLGLVPAIRWYGRTMLEDAGLAVTYALPAETPTLTEQQSAALFRIIQEAMNNIVHHAGARRARITLDAAGGEICLVVADDGVGFDPETIGRRLGLLGMIERAALLGGHLDLDTAPGQGTRIRVRAPVAGAAAAACEEATRYRSGRES